MRAILRLTRNIAQLPGEGESASGSMKGLSPMATPVSTGRGSLITSNTPAGPEQKIASAWAPLAEKSGPSK